MKRELSIIALSLVFVFRSGVALTENRPGSETVVKNRAIAEDTGGYNRLIHEKSPYLLQHAANPVDWFPWGEEAFNKAKKEDKPIFLSVDYSTCHWCHVMEHESFSDKEVAEILNRHFISIFFKMIYNIKAGGNFRDEATGHSGNGNILHLKKPVHELAEALGASNASFDHRLEGSRKKLFDIRKQRIHPFKDDKILTDWNGLMIAALDRAGKVLNETEYSHAAAKSARFIVGIVIYAISHP